MDTVAEDLGFLAQLGLYERLALVLIVAIAAHMLVIGIRRLGEFWMGHSRKNKNRKLMSIISLTTSSLIFIIYFFSAGFILGEFGVPVGAYFASATIIGLAVGFGSQGLVQDVVSGLTTIFSDIFDVGDMIEISSQIGIVRKIGLRFIEIENSFGARVIIPNRSVTNVVKYPRGYIRCIVDITLPSSELENDNTRQLIAALAKSVPEQFPAILVTPPTIEGEQKTSGGRTYIRLKFRIWPGRGAPIEQSFKPEVVQTMKKIDASYSDWMISVHYEVELKSPLQSQINP